MLCNCCVSLRGLAYFGASTHIVVGVMFCVEFLESLFSLTNSKLMQTDTINIGTERLVYHWVFLSLGLLIFQAIDRESKTLLRRSTIIFLFLQALTFAVRLKYGVMYSASLKQSPTDPNKSESNVNLNNPDLYRGWGLSILATVAYLIILFLYVKRLDDTYHTRLFRATLSTTNPTHIPLSTTNLGWYSQSRCSRGTRNGGGSGGSNHNAMYSPLNFFGAAGGFNPLVWTNPGPPPPYSDAAPGHDSPSMNSRNLLSSTGHGHHHTVEPPCSSSAAVNIPIPHNNSSVRTSAEQETMRGSEGKILNTSMRTSSVERTDSGDPSVVPLLEDEGEDKSGLEC